MNDNLNDEHIALLSSELDAAAPSPTQKSNIFARIQNNIAAQAPAGSTTLRAEEGEWVNLLPLIDIKVLHQDKEANTQVAIWRLQPGAVIPAHPHSQNEECLMLEGEAHVGEYRLCAGDFHLVRSGFEHPEISSKTGAMVMVRGEYMEELAA